jgi:hypothetical protein
MAPTLRETAEWHLMQKWQKILPDLEDAVVRLLLPELEKSAIRLKFNPAIPGGLNTDAFLEDYFKPPADLQELKTQLLADLVVVLLFPQKRLDLIIAKSFPEIEEAYNVILKEGGGWSSYADKSNPEKRKTTVMSWYKVYKSRLMYLNEKNLNNPILYNPVVTQEKRDFYVRLLSEIIMDVGSKELTLRKLIERHKKFNKLKQHPILKDILNPS